MAGSFKILHFPEEGATDVVFLENMTSDLFIESESEVFRYVRVFGKLRELALGEEETIALVEQIASQIE
jgi:hypothetical protein